ncbi:MAG: AP endonuclease [Spirochaetaceae bacterium]|jgi:hypothetical protein|nr:AP endonuclease [Spirochaetaceae bacterium]
MSLSNIKIAVPSWVIPGTYLENLRFLEDKKDISAVELLFFVYDEGVKDELAAELAGIAAYKDRFVFSAHLPDEILPEHTCLVETLAPLVRHFIVHPSRNGGAIAEATLLADWSRRFGREKFVIENTKIQWFNDLIALLPPDTGICMDTGHLLLEGILPAAFAKTYGSRLREIHLHDVDTAADDGRLPDHRSLKSESSWLSDIRPFLAQFNGFINLEVFSWEEIQKSLEVLHGIY